MAKGDAKMIPNKRYLPSGPVLPKAQAFADFVNVTELWSGLTRRPAAETRAMMTPPLTRSLPDFPTGQIHDFTIPVAGADIVGRLYAPLRSPVDTLIIWCHGGGFTFGSVAADDNFLRRLVIATGAAVLAVDYRLAPEFPFPVPLNDVLTAIRWAAGNRSTMFGDDTQLFVAGDSAGANLATVAAMLLRGSEVVIAGQVLAYPSTDANPQLLQGFISPFLKVDEILWFWDQYIPERSLRGDPRFSPMREPHLRGMPPALIFTAEHDLFTEQSEAYGQRLTEQGVSVRLRRFPGQVHGFFTADLFAKEEGAVALADVSTFVSAIRSGAKC